MVEQDIPFKELKEYAENAANPMYTPKKKNSWQIFGKILPAFIAPRKRNRGVTRA